MINRVRALVDLKQIKKNLKILFHQAKSNSTVKCLGAVPMIKSNAYGHGIVEVAKSLLELSETTALGVASYDEALFVRKHCKRGHIWIFSGSSPFDDEKIVACLRFNLTPVIFTIEDLLVAIRVSKNNRSFKFHLKFNTGMNRLGIDFKNIDECLKLLKNCHGLEGICTHFAEAENESSKFNKMQILKFKEIVKLFSKFKVQYIHAANSWAIVRPDLCGTGEICNIIRPGIGVYGYAGKLGEKLGLKPTLKLQTKIGLKRFLNTGNTIGYGRTYKVKEVLEEFILTIGYGDGFHRSLSNKKILIENKLIQILGRVSMDLICIRLSSKKFRNVKIDDWVTLIGESAKQCEHLAKNSDTISYEVLTSISQRVPRVYS